MDMDMHEKVCENIEVEYTELDLVYTLLGVPQQQKATTIAFFMVNAHILSHRQRVRHIIPDGNVNINTYAPKRQQIFRIFLFC
eukprot:3992740-Ditylum_brightwellii.AAC.1